MASLECSNIHCSLAKYVSVEILSVILSLGAILFIFRWYEQCSDRIASLERTLSRNQRESAKEIKQIRDQMTELQKQISSSLERNSWQQDRIEDLHGMHKRLEARLEEERDEDQATLTNNIDEVNSDFRKMRAKIGNAFADFWQLEDKVSALENSNGAYQKWHGGNFKQLESKMADFETAITAKIRRLVDTTLLLENRLTKAIGKRGGSRERLLGELISKHLTALEPATPSDSVEMVESKKS